MNRGKILIKTVLVMFLGFVLAPPLSLASTPKKLTVGIALRLNDKFNGTVNSMAEGIEAAKLLFEQDHPEVTIDLKRFSHDEELTSVVSTSQNILDSKVPAVIGGELSEESIVLGDRLGERKIVFVTPTSSNPKVTEGKPFVFRACFADGQVADQLAKFVAKELKPKAIGVVHNISSPYTDFLSQRFIEAYKKESGDNGASLFEQKVLRQTAVFEKEIQYFIDHKVTHVAVLTHQDDLLRFVSQAKEKGFFPVYVGSDGWGSNENLYSKLVNGSESGAKFIAFRNNYWRDDATSPLITRFKATIEKKTGQKANAWHAITFDAAWLLFTAMAKTKNAGDGEAIRRSMASLKPIALTTAQHFSFGPDNSPHKDLYIYKISKAGIQYEATLK